MLSSWCAAWSWHVPLVHAVRGRRLTVRAMRWLATRVVVQAQRGAGTNAAGSQTAECGGLQTAGRLVAGRGQGSAANAPAPAGGGKAQCGAATVGPAALETTCEMPSGRRTNSPGSGGELSCDRVTGHRDQEESLVVCYNGSASSSRDLRHRLWAEELAPPGYSLLLRAPCRDA